MTETENSSNTIFYFKGTCACKRMSYECTELPSCVSTCHCITCRTLSGGPYQTYADVHSKSITFYDTAEHLRYEGLPKDSIGGIQFLRLTKLGERAYCVACHTPLAMRYKHEDHVTGLALGTVDEGSFLGNEKTKEALTPQMHIFVSQKVWWVDLSKDALPAHQRFRGDFEANMTASEGKEG